jgi:hypothetical protein
MDQSRGPVGSKRSRDFHALRRGVADGTLAFTRGAREIDIFAGRVSDLLFTARFQGRQPRVSVNEKSTVRVHYRFGPQRTLGLIRLNPAVKWSIQIWGGATHFHADLTGLVLASISIDGGASHVTLRLPEPSARVPVHIRRGASQVTILRPPGVPAGLDVRKGASQLVFDEQRFGALGGDIQLRSPTGNGSSGRYDIDVGGGASRLSVGISHPATTFPEAER